MTKRVVKTACGMCIEECGINVHVDDGKIVKVEGMPEHPYSEGFICASARSIPEYVHYENRIKYPMRKEKGEWKRISWDEALDTIASKVKESREKDGPQAFGVFTGDPVNMALRMGYYLIWRFCDIYGTPNRFYDGDLCFTPRIRAYFQIMGKMVTPDLINSKCILNWGTNQKNSFPPLHNRIQKAIKNNGAKLIVIDPRRIPLAKQADIFVQPRPGTDGYLALAMMNVIISEGIYDKEFVERWTVGFDKLADHVKAYTPEEAERVTGVAADDVRKIARMYATTKPACMNAGMKLEQTASGFHTARSIVMLQVLTGNIDVPGGGVLRLSGVHERSYRLPKLMRHVKCVGGDRYPIYHKAGRVFYEGCMPNWGDLVLKGEPHRMKILFVAGGNPAVTWPNTNKVNQALENLDFLAVMDPFWTATAEKAHMVLPACTFIERMNLCTIYEGHSVPAIQMRRPAIKPLWESWSDCQFWLALARRMGGEFDQYIPWNTDEEAMDYWLSPSGLTVKYLTEEHPTGIIVGSNEPVFDYHKHGFDTPSGKCEFYSEELVEMGIDPLPIYREPPESPISSPQLAREYPLVLTTGVRELEYWHSQQRHCARLQRRNPEATAEIHPCTASEYGIADGDYVIIETARGQARMKAKVTEDIRRGMVATAHGWLGDANENLLTDDTPVDPEGGYPAFAASLCRITKEIISRQ